MRKDKKTISLLEWICGCVLHYCKWVTIMYIVYWFVSNVSWENTFRIVGITTVVIGLIGVIGIGVNNSEARK